MQLIYLIPLFVVLAFLAYIIYQFLIKIYIDGYRFKRMDPNLKVFIAPFSGLIGLQKECLRKYGDTHYFIKEMVKQDPDMNAYLTNLGNRPFLILTDAKLVKEMTLNPKNFRKLNLFKHVEKAYEKGIFFVEDSEWKSVRSTISHAFSFDQLKRMIPIMSQSTDEFIQDLHLQIAKNSEKKLLFGIMEETQNLIGEILLKTFFYPDAKHLKAGKVPLTQALENFTVGIFDRSRSGVNLLTSLLFGDAARRTNFSKGDTQLKILLDDIRVCLFNVIEQRIASHQTEQNRDFMHHYINEMIRIDKALEEAQRQGKPCKQRKITKQQIVQQMITFYFAGIDTTGHLMAFAIYSLAEYGQYRERMVKELDSIIPTPEHITYKNLQKLEFMGKFLDECLRMWPPATGSLTRVTREDIKIGPYNIPKNTCVGINIIGLMHNPKYYKDPHVFNPDRWYSKSEGMESYAFIPFSAGNRSCIGKEMSLMETKLILAHFIREFDIVRSEVPLRLTAKLLYQPVDDRLVYLKKGGSPYQAYQTQKVEAKPVLATGQSYEESIELDNRKVVSLD